MFKKIAVLLATLLTLLLVPATSALAEQGVLNGDQYTFTDRQGNTVTVPVNSFASYVVDFQHGDPWRSEGDTNTDPRIALGLPDGNDGNDSIGDLALGVGGCLVLGFDVAIYDGPGDDVYVFETGGYVEETRIELSDDLATWYEIGVAEGRTAGLDIAGKVPQGSGFRYVRLTDTGNNPAGGWPGADIDAVCGLSTRALPPDTGGDTASSSARTGDATAGDTAAGDAMPGDATVGGVPQGMPALDGWLDLVGTWQGFYLGHDDGAGVIRRIRVGITECDNGAFAGTLFFETPTNPEVMGEYRIMGTVDGGGNVHFQV